MIIGMPARKPQVRYQVITDFSGYKEAHDFRSLSAAKREAERRTRAGYSSIILRVESVAIGKAVP